MLLVFEHCGARQPCPTAKEEPHEPTTAACDYCRYPTGAVYLDELPWPVVVRRFRGGGSNTDVCYLLGHCAGHCGHRCCRRIMDDENVELVADRSSLCAQHPFECVGVSDGATWRTQSPYHNTDHRLCPYTRADSASEHAACFGSCRTTFARKVSRVSENKPGFRELG